MSSKDRANPLLVMNQNGEAQALQQISRPIPPCINNGFFVSSGYGVS